MAESLNKRYLSALEKFAFTVIAVGVSTTATFQWRLYQEQEADRLQRIEILNIIKADKAEMMNLLKLHDARMTAIELELAKIKGEMVGWETLKRIELYVSQLAPEEAAKAISRALKAEIEARKTK